MNLSKFLFHKEFHAILSSKVLITTGILIYFLEIRSLSQPKKGTYKHTSNMGTALDESLSSTDYDFL